MCSVLLLSLLQHVELRWKVIRLHSWEMDESFGEERKSVPLPTWLLSNRGKPSRCCSGNPDRLEFHTVRSTGCERLFRIALDFITNQIPPEL